MNAKNAVIVIVGMMIGTMVLKGAEVTDVTARQRYPWNGLVDIGCTLSGNAGTTYQLIVSAVDKVGGTNMTVKTVNIEGSPEVGNPVSATPGTHRLVWNADADLPKGYRSSRVSIRVKAVEMVKKYMVVNLSNGVIEYTDTTPSGGWDQTVYKTTHMVFQRVEAGTYRQFYRSKHYGRNVTISKPFYMSLYPLTNGQWISLMGGTCYSGTETDSKMFSGEMPSRICNGVTFLLRGDTRYDADTPTFWPVFGHTVASSSFIGVLRTRTGKENFDVPTSGVLSKAAQSMSLPKRSVCMDWCPDLWEVDVIDPMGPATPRTGFGLGGYATVQVSGVVGTYLSSTSEAAVHICYYDAE
ncbi:MAG: hypothetical protein Q4E56_04010 [Pseudomonadota bacterium]|nr:hypothetical protein [Pseudomonadota bacterium]